MNAIVRSVAILSCMLLGSKCLYAVNDKDDGILEAIRSVAVKEDADYLSGRQEIERTYEKHKRNIDQLGTSSEDWRIRLLCKILKERSEKKEGITYLSNNRPYGGGHASRDRYGTSKTIASAAKDCPYSIAELLWKTNELSKWKCDRYLIARAVGLLKVDELRELIENEIIHGPNIGGTTQDIVQYREYIREELSYAIGDMGDYRSLPVLLALFEHIDKTGSSRDLMPVYGALLKCVNDKEKKRIEMLVSILNKSIGSDVTETESQLQWRRSLVEVVRQIIEEHKLKPIDPAVLKITP